MQYRTLGKTGVEVSEIGFGGAGAGLRNYLRRWDASQEANSRLVEDAIQRAIELGINYFDTAPLYGSEEMFGRALKSHREQVFIATKVREKDAFETYRSIEGSLERLQCDHLDLIQYHGGWYTDEEVDTILKPGGVLAGMRAAQQEGLVRFVGFTTEGANAQASTLIDSGEFDVVQLQYNLFFQHPYDPDKRAGQMFDSEKQGLGIAVMRPFTGGAFPRWIQQAYPDLDADVDVSRFMASLLAFVLSNPLTDVALVGMRSVKRVEQNVAIVDDLANRVDLDQIYGRFLRRSPETGEETWVAL